MSAPSAGAHEAMSVKLPASVSPPGTESRSTRRRSLFVGARSTAAVINQQASPPTKAKLPAIFLSVAADNQTDLAESAESPETITTSISCHGTSIKAVTDMATAALTEIFYEREIFPRIMFREQSRFGLAMHRAGSPATTADDKLAGQLAQAFGHLNRLEQLIASRPDRIVISVVAASDATLDSDAASLRPSASPLEQWIFDLEMSEVRAVPSSDAPATAALADLSPAAEQARSELRAELAIILRQVRASSVFLPGLDGPVQVVMQAAAVPSRAKEPSAEECSESDAEDETEDDEDDEDDEAFMSLPHPRTPPPQQLPAQLSSGYARKQSAKRAHQRHFASSYAALAPAASAPATSQPELKVMQSNEAAVTTSGPKLGREQPPVAGSPVLAISAWLIGTALAVVAVAYMPLGWGSGPA